MLKNDFRYFKRGPTFKPAQECVKDDSSDITSWSSNAFRQYRKFSAETLVIKAVKSLAERKGSSVVAIKKYMINHYPYVDGKFTLPVIRRVIKRALLKGKLVQCQGNTMDGRFKISAGEIRAEQQQEQFKHLKECLKLREHQKQELERKILKNRAKEKQKRQSIQEKEFAELQQRKKAANAAKLAKANLTARAAKDMLNFTQNYLKQNEETYPFKATQRLGAGTSKSFQPPQAQIVDYADAAVATAKVISSEQLRKAIITAAEYVPNLPAFDGSNLRRDLGVRHMPIKYERTIRKDNPVDISSSDKFNETPKYLNTIFPRNKLPGIDAAVNFRSPSAESVVGQNTARNKAISPVSTAGTITKRAKGNTGSKSGFNSTKAVR
ncbi:unnamed protein product [Ceratitis capitata]|uniref:(Mediterranean fruit fly) hypothetical protein n=1 Tax=Ceratitis capitata TaxID=7213 RepID=W8BYY2_CERCA|nr:unnamed protein product [Ceratitis capitata]